MSTRVEIQEEKEPSIGSLSTLRGPVHINLEKNGREKRYLSLLAHLNLVTESAINAGEIQEEKLSKRQF